jgi:hypothetical protein
MLPVANLEQAQLRIALTMHITFSILGTVASLMLLAAPAHARTWAGTVDMIDLCKKAQADAGLDAADEGPWTPNTGDKTNPSAFDWVCTDDHGNGNTHLDMSGWCKYKYTDQPNAYADPQGGGPFDWGCYYP